MLRSSPVEDPNLRRGEWTGQKFFGINLEISLPVGMGMIVDGKHWGIRRVETSGQ